MSRHEATRSEAELVIRLREIRRQERDLTVPTMPQPRLRWPSRVADAIARALGSWTFILIQTSVLLVWVAINITAFLARWDPYPFILLNLALSFQAAYSAPLIMMSQNRQAAADRREAEGDYRTNLKAELEVELLHCKLDQIAEKLGLEWRDPPDRPTGPMRASEDALEADSVGERPDLGRVGGGARTVEFAYSETATVVVTRDEDGQR
ncbi:MAG: DUF1003 domain-containing protein [Caulobacterales bacterium]|nr:DUF1003 domain-containing protein [Caulobacterales bacterium]